MFNGPAGMETRPRHRWRLWLLLIGAPLLALVLSGVGWVLRANSGLQSAIDEADRLDPRWQLEEIEADRATTPPGQNGADKIVAIKKLWPARPWGPDYKTQQSFVDLPSVNRLNDEQIAALKDLLGPAGPALAEARPLIDTPSGRHPITYTPVWWSTLLPTIQSSREAVTLLRFYVFDRAEAGDIDGAVRSCHAAFHAGCSIGDEPCLIAQLTRIACQAAAINLLERALAQGEPSGAVLTALQARIEATEPEPLLLYGLRGERAGANQLLENLRNGTVPVKGIATLMQTDSTLEAMLRVPGFITIQQTGYLHFMNEMVAIAKLPPEMWAGPLAQLHAKLNELPILARLLVGAHSKAAEGFQRNHALLRCAIVAIAAERYRRQNGHWPATPDDLVKAGLLKSVPTDPYTAGQSIKFGRPADGLMIYTTGEDGKDDGGKLNPDARKAGFDFGFRLWDVASRRQPPLPPSP